MSLNVGSSHYFSNSQFLSIERDPMFAWQGCGKECKGGMKNAWYMINSKHICYYLFWEDKKKKKRIPILLQKS